MLEALELTETEILDSIDQLGLLSAPLAGFIDHLTTKFQGSHVQPFAKLPGRRVTIGEETDLTPYRTSVRVPQGASMFKPATHGQFCLTKVNIIAKFGQVVDAVDPTVPAEAEPLYPCISEQLRPRPLPDKSLVVNAVLLDGLGKCESVQLPPARSTARYASAGPIARSPPRTGFRSARRPSPRSRCQTT